VAVVPNTHTFVNGVRDSSEENTYIRDPLLFLMNKPAAELRQTVAQSLANNTWTSLTFDVEDLDNDPSGTGGHSTSVNTSRYTAVYAGWYVVGGCAAFVANATGIRGHRWAVNGNPLNGESTLVQAVSVGGSNTDVPASAARLYLNVGDYVEAQAIQGSGGALNTFVTATAQSSMTIGWDRN
jgi:hypothetical protein